MSRLYGKQYSKNELLKRVGDMSQIAGIRPVELTSGPERGVRGFECTTGSGLSFTVLGDRALDIFDAKYNGWSLCWHSPTGAVAPAFYDRHDLGWLWSFYGGLVLTCGLSQAGAPNRDGQEDLGLHGRLSSLPAQNICVSSEWKDDDYIMRISGTMREGKLFGPNLLLRRTIECQMGLSKIVISDEIENQGFQDAPFMLLYHCNMGFPIVDKGSELVAAIKKMQPRDAEAEKGVDAFTAFEEPTAGYKEQCFYIDHAVDGDGFVNVALVNRQFNNNQGLGVYLSYPKKVLPNYTQWKMMGQGDYVVGMEPGNCVPEGRASARNRGVLKILQPGEKVKIDLEIGVLANNSEIKTFKDRLKKIGDQ
jgi:hypothetical protein